MAETAHETRTVQAMHAIDRLTGAVIPPLHTSTTYARDTDNALIGQASSLCRPGPAPRICTLPLRVNNLHSFDS